MFLDFGFGPFLIIFANSLLVEISYQDSMLFCCIVATGYRLVDNGPIAGLGEHLKRSQEFGEKLLEQAIQKAA